MKKALIFVLGLGALDTVTANGINQNFIVNGRFTQSECRADACIFNKAEEVVGWIPEPEIEVGSGYIYNTNLGNERVVDLAAKKNGCIKQIVRGIYPGNYTLRYEYTTKEGRTFDDSLFEVFIDGVSTKKITPKNYQVHIDTIDIEIKDKRETEVKFCSFGGENNDHGAILRTVSMVQRVAGQQQAGQKNGSTNQQQQSTQQKTETLPRLVIQSHFDKCYQRQYPLQAGQLEISFDYTIDSKESIKDSVVHVIFNGQSIHKMSPSDSGKKTKLKGSIQKGSYTIGFCPAGASNETPHQVSIANIQISQNWKNKS